MTESHKVLRIFIVRSGFDETTGVVVDIPVIGLTSRFYQGVTCYILIGILQCITVVLALQSSIIHEVDTLFIQRFVRDLFVLLTIQTVAPEDGIHILSLRMSDGIGIVFGL